MSHLSMRRTDDGRLVIDYVDDYYPGVHADVLSVTEIGDDMYFVQTFTRWHGRESNREDRATRAQLLEHIATLHDPDARDELRAVLDTIGP